MTPVRRRAALAIGLDFLVVVSFVAAGRRNHDGDNGVVAVASVAAPFLLALVASWLLARAWRRPHQWWTGGQIWIGTLALGMVLRRLVFGDGTSPSFVMVAGVFLGVFLVGWRAVAVLVFKNSSAGDASSAH